MLGALVVLLCWLAVGAVGGPATGRLSEVQKNDNASFLPTEAESTAVLDKVSGFSDEEEVPLILVAEQRDGGYGHGEDPAQGGHVCSNAHFPGNLRLHSSHAG